MRYHECSYTSYGYHHRRVVTTLPLLPTKIVAYYVAVVQYLMVQGADTIKHRVLAWTPANSR